MAGDVVWSPEAAEDLEHIVDYIARDSLHYARSVATRLVTVARSISEHPELVRVVPELADLSLRERLVHRYRLIYRIEKGRFLIVAIIHGSRDLERLISDMPDMPDVPPD